jgi:hypothetical protein
MTVRICLFTLKSWSKSGFAMPACLLLLKRKIRTACIMTALHVAHVCITFNLTLGVHNSCPNLADRINGVRASSS